jgi:hypothetical protein
MMIELVSVPTRTWHQGSDHPAHLARDKVLLVV